MFKVGITERGDAGLDFSWVKKLLDINIIISKNLNDQLILHLLKHKEKIIFHCTCTGLGSSEYEPNVPNAVETKKQLLKLIENGFPINQIVLRVDPIIPNYLGMTAFNNVLGYFSDTGVKRVRYSYLDLYPHVQKRFDEANVCLWESSAEKQSMVNEVQKTINYFRHVYTFESCAEVNGDQLGCISNKDFSLMGKEEVANSLGPQRKACMCHSGKTELLKSKTRCASKCIYCYWQD